MALSICNLSCICQSTDINPPPFWISRFKHGYRYSFRNPFIGSLAHQRWEELKKIKNKTYTLKRLKQKKTLIGKAEQHGKSCSNISGETKPKTSNPLLHLLCIYSSWFLMLISICLFIFFILLSFYFSNFDVYFFFFLSLLFVLVAYGSIFI